MPVLLIKVTLLFAGALVALSATRRATAAVRHLLCVCALAGSLLLPIAALFPARVIAVRLPAIEAVATSHTVAQAASWPSAGMIFGLWGLGCAMLIVRLAIGHRRIARLVRAATPVGQGAVYLAEVGGPIVCGLLRPVVLMPRASSEWPDWQFDAALRHELTHARRKDLWANFIAHLACAVWWFHPLVWMLMRRQRDCQETACDDAVLFAGFEPTAYAEALLAVAQTSTRNLVPGCSMTTQTDLKTRIARLLDRSIARTTSRANLIRIAAGVAIVIAAIGILSPLRSRAQSESRPDAAGVYKAGGEVISPSVIYKTEPQYTEYARKEKIAGTTRLSLVIGTDGLAHDISVTQSVEPGLDQSAAEAVQKWHFAPGTLHGEPVAVKAVIDVNFRLL